jgi:signal transduction histidine kinase
MPGSAAAAENVAATGWREVLYDFRPADPASDADHLHEVCHDMRQPVASIIALADAALSQAAVPLSVRGRLGQVRDQAEWLGDLLQSLVEPPEPKMAEDESCDLSCLASDVVEIEAVTYMGGLVMQCGEGDRWVLGNSVELRRAIANLLSNATRAAGPAGEVVVELRHTADRVVLTVDDSGPGFGLIRQGIGVGLQAVARGLKTYGGGLEYSQSPMGGVRAVLALRAAGHPGVGCDDASGPL